MKTKRVPPLNGSPQIGSILAYVDGGAGSAYVIEAAARLGKTFSCYVEVLHIEKDVDTSLFAMDVSGGLAASSELFRIMQEQSAAYRATAKQAFDDFCLSQKIAGVAPDSPETLTGGHFSLAWHLMTGNEGRELAHRGRLFDLIVMAKAEDQVGGVDSVQLESALFDSGRPLLVTTEDASPADPSSIVIAWDGSREAAHSVALAMPFLAMAEKIFVVSVGDRDPGMEAEDLRRYLARHKVEAECCHPDSAGAEISSTLTETSLGKGAGMLVMGAYGHSALGESLFGGVTRSLLETGKLSLFLAH